MQLVIAHPLNRNKLALLAILVLTLTATCLCVYLPGPVACLYADSAYKGEDALLKLSLTVKTDLKEYIPLQPVIATVTLENRNPFAVKVNGETINRRGTGWGDLRLYRRQAGKEEWNPAPQIIMSRSGRKVVHEFILSAGEKRIKRISMAYKSSHEESRLIGEFEFKAVQKDLKGNIIEVPGKFIVKKPQGADVNAMDYLMKNKEIADFIDCDLQTELLIREPYKTGKKFVERHFDSTYAIYMTYTMTRSAEWGSHICGRENPNRVPVPDYGLAIPLFQKCAEFAGHFPLRDEAMFHIAKCYYNLEDYDMAIAYLDDVIEACDNPCLVALSKELRYEYKITKKREDRKKENKDK